MKWLATGKIGIYSIILFIYDVQWLPMYRSIDIPMLPTMCTLAVYQCQQYIPVFTSANNTYLCLPVPTIHSCVYRISANNTYLCLPVPTIHSCVYRISANNTYLCLPVPRMNTCVHLCRMYNAYQCTLTYAQYIYTYLCSAWAIYMHIYTIVQNCHNMS